MSNMYERKDNGDGTYSHNSHLTGSDIIQQTDLQYRRQKAIQTHTGANLAPSGANLGVWIDTDGFNEISVTMVNDASTSNTVELYWSNDGSVNHGYEIAASNSTSRYRVFTLPTRSRYVKVTLVNGDVAAHIMSAWAYLKV